MKVKVILKETIKGVGKRDEIVESSVGNSRKYKKIGSTKS